jgi:hypothetical protein
MAKGYVGFLGQSAQVANENQPLVDAMLSFPEEYILGVLSPLIIQVESAIVEREPLQNFILPTEVFLGLPQVPSLSPGIAQLPDHPRCDGRKRARHTSSGE